jgi:hypothetical protein
MESFFWWTQGCICHFWPNTEGAPISSSQSKAFRQQPYAYVDDVMSGVKLDQLEMLLFPMLMQTEAIKLEILM